MRIPAKTSGGSPLRWGIGDAFGSYVAGLLGAVLAGSVAIGVVGVSSGEEHGGVLIASLVGQFIATVTLLLVTSRRKGRGTLRADFGFTIRPSDWRFLPLGAGFQVVIGWCLLPLNSWAGLGEDETQEVVNRLKEAGGAELWVTALAAVLVAPIVEEVLFRGLLLRSLQRRVSPVAALVISSVIFAGVHLADGSLGSLVAFPGLVAVGMGAGLLAFRGDLSRSILLHAGFNALTVVALVAT